MQERDIAHKFTDIFKQYPLLVPSMNAESGWPDRFIQLPNSKLIAAEIKSIQVNKHKYFVLTTFRQSQAAWMAKWQRNGGIGFLFIGLSIDNEFIGFHVLTCAKWTDWLGVNSQKYYLEKLSVFPTKESVELWFDAYVYRGNRQQRVA